jgi:hypothetical protein
MTLLLVCLTISKKMTTRKMKSLINRSWHYREISVSLVVYQTNSIFQMGKKEKLRKMTKLVGIRLHNRLIMHKSVAYLIIRISSPNNKINQFHHFKQSRRIIRTTHFRIKQVRNPQKLMIL